MEEKTTIEEAICEVGEIISRSLDRLGLNGASTPMGAIEAHSQSILDASETIARAINNVADALRELADARHKAGANS